MKLVSFSIGLDIVECDTVIGGVCFMHRTQSRKGHGRGPGRQRGAGSKKRQKAEWMNKWQHATIVAPTVSMVADGSMTMDGMKMTAGVDGGH